MENLLFIFAVIFFAYAICSKAQVFKEKRKIIKQKECNEQLLKNFKSIIENLSVVKYVNLQSFVYNQGCNGNGDKNVVYLITGNSDEVNKAQELAKKRLMWKKIYNKLFN